MAVLKTISTRTFQKDGKWIEKSGKTAILICSCGNKYIKTRPDQIVCILCIGKSKK